MQQILEQLANDTGLTIEEAKCLFTAFAALFIARIPALKIIVDDVVDEADENIINEHISKLILLLQEQQCKAAFGNWIIPQPDAGNHKISGSNSELF
jgi:hypothetical protein